MKVNWVIKKPLFTEKGMALVSRGQYPFVVDKRANKALVKSALKSLFQVDTIKIRLIKVKGKAKRVGPGRRLLSKKSAWKKVIVQLKEGQKIDIFEEVKSAKK